MSWLDMYCEYAKNNEAIASYHWWCGITILGTALRRNAYFSKAYYTIWPNMWTLLIGPSGSGKTTACIIARKTLSRLDNVRILADKTSPEALADSLAEKDEYGKVESQGLIFAPELSNFMDRRQHNEGLVPFLLGLKDNMDSWSYKTRGGGPVTLRNICVSFLGATANDLIYSSIPPLALKSGFLARFICIMGEGREGGVPFPWKDEPLEREVSNSLYEISLLKGNMALPPKARDWYVNWYYIHKRESAQESSEKLRAYYERKPDYVLQVAMLIAISKTRILQYTVEAMEEALERLADIEPGLLKLYDEVGSSDPGREQMKILQQLVRAGGIMSHTELIKMNHSSMGDATIIRKHLQTLVEAGKVVVDRMKGTGEIRYRARK